MQASDSLVSPPIGTLAFHTDPAWQVNASSHMLTDMWPSLTSVYCWQNFRSTTDFKLPSLASSGFQDPQPNPYPVFPSPCPLPFPSHRPLLLVVIELSAQRTILNPFKNYHENKDHKDPREEREPPGSLTFLLLHRHWIT